jgi:CDP-diacylglycerol--serine O-phosphatidyltransferase
VFLPWLRHVFPTHIAGGVYLIVLSMVFDALDGRLARMTRRTSEFGAQLDSISDIVSFGVAPIAMLIAILLRPSIGNPEELDVTGLQFRLGLLAAIVYISCAAIRLARYNVENVKGGEAQRAFSGLPTPGAAAALIALIAVHENFRTGAFTLGNVDGAGLMRWGIIAMALASGLLMVSRLDYVHVFNVYFRRKRPPTHLVWFVIILCVGWYSFELLLVALALAYLASGLILSLLHRRRQAK